MLPKIKFHFCADDAKLLFHKSHKNTGLAFDKQNSTSSRCSRMDKTEFVIFGSHTQLKKLDSHLSVRIIGNFMHPPVVVKNLDVWFDANFSFADHVRSNSKTCFIQKHDLRQIRQYHQCLS